MKIPIEAIKGALWWLKDGMDNVDLSDADWRKTKCYKEELESFIEENEKQTTSLDFKCPLCGESWDTTKYNACQCGAVLAKKDIKPINLGGE